MIPKFRAWDKKLKEMIRVVSINFDEEFIRGLTELESYLDMESSYNFEDIELLQSTGLKDVHEVEFFDKDIARDIDSGELGVVEYINGSFVMKFVGGDGVDLYDVKDNFEIIGNKFQHPHLLEE